VQGAAAGMLALRGGGVLQFPGQERATPGEAAKKGLSKWTSRNFADRVTR